MHTRELGAPPVLRMIARRSSGVTRGLVARVSTCDHAREETGQRKCSGMESARRAVQLSNRRSTLQRPGVCAANPKTTEGPVTKASGKASTQKRYPAPRCSVRRLPRWRQFAVCLLFSWREAQENDAHHDGRIRVVPIERPVQPTATPCAECSR